MSDIAIRVEGLGKQYRIGRRERYRTLRDTLSDAVAAPVRRLRSALRGVDREQENNAASVIWALKNVSFQVPRGGVIGIIGRNGAGKSTLLKILSRITEPTEGYAEVRGRVGSLLEVGTGFHPELTGRENIYLNGAILGMKKTEIERKFDEIVAFAEVERFIDTPVKHYSSGMYTRLAFAVAAHLESEILLVDEVLAVGDAEFQKKCLGAMEHVSQEYGRTVLFVSHNMAAVKSLTKSGVFLDHGLATFEGPVDSVIQRYLECIQRRNSNVAERSWGRGTHTAISDVRLLDAAGRPTTHYVPGESLRIQVELETDGASGMSLEIVLNDGFRSRIGLASTYFFHGQMLPSEKGVYTCHLVLEPLWLASGTYSVDVATSIINVGWDHHVESALDFDVPFSNPLGREFDFKYSYGHGSLALLCSEASRFEPAAACEAVGAEKR
jgi:lipopolysaccharide transport system ATP-binding protein